MDLSTLVAVAIAPFLRRDVLLCDCASSSVLQPVDIQAVLVLAVTDRAGREHFCTCLLEDVSIRFCGGE